MPNIIIATSVAEKLADVIEIADAIEASAGVPLQQAIDSNLRKPLIETLQRLERRLTSAMKHHDLSFTQRELYDDADEIVESRREHRKVQMRNRAAQKERMLAGKPSLSDLMTGELVDA